MNDQEKMERLKVLNESIIKNKEGIDLLVISSIGAAKSAVVEGNGFEIINSIVSVMNTDTRIAHILSAAVEAFKEIKFGPSIAIKKVNHSKDVN